MIANLQSFESFTPLHLLTVAALATVVTALTLLGRRWRGNAAGRLLELALAFALAALWVAYQLHDWRRYGFDVRWSLPLQLCDFAALAAALALARPRRTLHALAYFWGLALSTQALITPDLAGGPGTLDYWAFWSYHAFVVGAAVYVVAVRGFRPRLRDLGVAVALGVAYAAVVFAVDAAFDLNYGYLGRRTPSRPTLLDVLGTWPMRALYMVLLGAAAMTVLWLPWAGRGPGAGVAASGAPRERGESKGGDR